MNVLTHRQCEALLIKAAGYDGRDPNRIAIESWHESAVKANWTDFAAALDAVTRFYSQPAKLGDRLWIMPGHVTEFLRANSRQPAPFDRLEIEGPKVASNEARAAAIRQYCEQMGRKKAVK